MAKKKKGKAFGNRDIVTNTEGENLPQPNQWQATEQQMKFLDLYMNPSHKETYANPYQAAITAGYSESYAKNIMSPSTALQWVKAAKTVMRSMNTEHLRSQLEDIVTDKMEDTRNRIAAIKLLGLDQGMFVQKQLVGHINIEDALNSLE